MRTTLLQLGRRCQGGALEAAHRAGFVQQEQLLLAFREERPESPRQIPAVVMGAEELPPTTALALGEYDSLTLTCVIGVHLMLWAGDGYSFVL